MSVKTNKIILIIVFISNGLFSQNNKMWEFVNLTSYKEQFSIPLSYQFSYGGTGITRHNIGIGMYIANNHLIEVETILEKRNNVIDINIYSNNISYGYNLFSFFATSSKLKLEILPVGGLSFNFVTKDETLLTNKGKFYMGINYGLRLEFILFYRYAITLGYRFENVLFNHNYIGNYRNHINLGVRFYI